MTNLTEWTTNSKKHAWKRSRLTVRAQKKARRGHVCREQGKWPGTQQEQQMIPRRRRKKKIRKGIASSRQRTLLGEFTAKTNLSEGTLGKGGEPVRVCNGASERAWRGGRRRICDRKSQTAGKEPCRVKSSIGKLKWANIVPKHAGDSRRSGRNIYHICDYVSRERNKTSAGTKEQALHRLMMGENPILQNKIGVGN